MIESILESVKKPLGLDKDYDAFDEDVIMHINSVFSTLDQIGAAPPEGFMIDGYDEKWDDFLGDVKQAQMVKTYVYLKVRLLFDPPQTSFLLDSIQKQITEYEWRLNVMEILFATEAPGGINDQEAIKALQEADVRMQAEIDEVDDDVDAVPDLELIFNNKLI